MVEKVVQVIGVRQFKGKDGKQYFVVDYYVHDKWIPKTDFISATEYNSIKKKLDDTHNVEAMGKFSVNDYDKVYLSDIEV